MNKNIRKMLEKSTHHVWVVTSEKILPKIFEEDNELLQALADDSRAKEAIIARDGHCIACGRNTLAKVPVNVRMSRNGSELHCITCGVTFNYEILNR